jgi:dienelactone hydrolase
VLAEPERWESWQAAAQRAARWLRDVARATRVAAVGLGSGGYLAFDAAASGAVDDVVLWATPPQGKRFLRELSAFARMEAHRIAESGGPPSPEQADGIEAGGHVLTPELADRIGAIDLEAASLPASARVLLLDRDGAGAAGSLEEALRGRGVDVESAEGRGYAAMVVPPDLSQPPREVFALVSAWLAGGAAAGRPPRARAEAVDTHAPAVELGGGVRERPIEIERPFGRLRGVLAEPSGGGGAAPLTLVFLNAGAIRRTGPNRLWVAAARRWAERGVPSLRLDSEGIGDADGDGGVYQEVGRFHDAHLLDHVTAAMDALAELGLPPRFVLIGLCAGGHWAFKTALRDERAAAAVMVNTRIVFWHDNLDPARDLRRTRLLVRPVTWKRILRGDVPVHRWKAFGEWAAAGLASRVRRTSAEPSVFAWQAAAVAEAFTSLREAGRSAHFVFCDGEPLRDELTGAGLLAQPERWPNVSVTFIPGREHTLKPVWMHAHAERALDDVIRREIALVPDTVPETV